MVLILELIKAGIVDRFYNQERRAHELNIIQNRTLGWYIRNAVVKVGPYLNEVIDEHLYQILMLVEMGVIHGKLAFEIWFERHGIVVKKQL